MNTAADLENLTLLIIRDAAEPPIWTEQWATGYPTVQTAECNAAEGITGWQHRVQAAFGRIGSECSIALIGHGVGANAAAAWYYQTDIAVQRRIAAIILAAPLQNACYADAENTFERVRFNCKTALVVGQNDPLSPQDWAEQAATLWRARFFCAPQTGHLNERGGNWQWGMKLLQEMLL